MSEGTWELAQQIAALANECCHRSDGYEENLRDKIAAAIKTACNEVHERELLYRRSAVEAEREACAKIADEHYTRGDHGSACTIGDECAGVIADAIRARGGRHE
jgi:hypothetical protein